MKTLFQKYKWLRIVLGATLLCAGVLTIILQATGVGTIETIISVILAVFCFIYGALIIATSLIKNPRTPFPMEIFIGGLFIGAGITLIIPGVITSIALLIVYLIACGVLTLGVLALVKAIIIICYKDPIQNWIVMLLCSLIGITGGILMLCFRTEVLASVNYVIGAAIAVLGVVEIVYGIVILAKKK